MRLAVSAAAAVLLCLPAEAPAQPQLAQAIAAGTVGERFDGYMGYPGMPPQRVRSQVAAVNIKRRALYTGLASQRGVSPAVAAVAAGCELLSRVAVGRIYMLSDGVWRRRDPGEPPPRPAQCPGV